MRLTDIKDTKQPFVMRKFNKQLSYLFLIGITVSLFLLSMMLINILVGHQIRSSNNLNPHALTTTYIVDGANTVNLTTP